MVTYIEKWDLYRSHQQLYFSDDCRKVKWESDGTDLIPAAIASLPSDHCILVLKVDKLPKNEGSVSFGLATNTFPPFGTEAFGARAQSCGIRSDITSLSGSIIATNGVWVQSYKNIRKGDILLMEVYKPECYAALFINDIEVQKFKIPYNTELIIGFTLCSGCAISILNYNINATYSTNHNMNTTNHPTMNSPNGIGEIVYASRSPSPSPTSNNMNPMAVTLSNRDKTYPSPSPHPKKTNNKTNNNSSNNSNIPGKKSNIVQSQRQRPYSASNNGYKSKSTTGYKESEPTLPATTPINATSTSTSTRIQTDPINIGDHMVMRISIEKERYLQTSHILTSQTFLLNDIIAATAAATTKTNLSGSNNNDINGTIGAEGFSTRRTVSSPLLVPSSSPKSLTSSLSPSRMTSVPLLHPNNNNNNNTYGSNSNNNNLRGKQSDVGFNNLNGIITAVATSTVKALFVHNEKSNNNNSPSRKKLQQPGQQPDGHPDGGQENGDGGGQQSIRKVYRFYDNDGKLKSEDWDQYLRKEERRQKELEVLKQITKYKLEKIEKNKLICKKENKMNISKSTPQLMKLKSEGKQDPDPVREIPEGYPTERIKMATEKWLKAVEKFIPRNHDVHDEVDVEVDYKIEPVRWSTVYDKMAVFDLIVSIEHCCNCEEHTSLRHNEDKYTMEAENVLIDMATWMHSAEGFQPLVRLGLVRLKRKIPPSSSLSRVKIPVRVTDDNPNPYRYGAFEVQRGLISETLHSKLNTSNWPSKTVLKRRLAGFLERSQVQSWMQRPVVKTDKDRDGNGNMQSRPLLHVSYCPNALVSPCPFGCRGSIHSQYFPQLEPLKTDILVVGVKGVDIFVNSKTNEVVEVDPRILQFEELRKAHNIGYPISTKIAGVKQVKEQQQQARSEAKLAQFCGGGGRESKSVVDDILSMVRYFPLEEGVYVFCEFAVGDTVRIDTKHCETIPASIDTTAEYSFVVGRVVASHVNGTYTIGCSANAHQHVLTWEETGVRPDVIRKWSPPPPMPVVGTTSSTTDTSVPSQSNGSKGKSSGADVTKSKSNKKNSAVTSTSTSHPITVSVDNYMSTSTSTSSTTQSSLAKKSQHMISSSTSTSKTSSDSSIVVSQSLASAASTLLSNIPTSTSSVLSSPSKNKWTNEDYPSELIKTDSFLNRQLSAASASALGIISESENDNEDEDDLEGDDDDSDDAAQTGACAYHPGPYNCENMAWYCCGGGDFHTEGCRLGRPRYHVGRYTGGDEDWVFYSDDGDGEGWKWQCCGQPSRKCDGCVVGVGLGVGARPMQHYTTCQLCDCRKCTPPSLAMHNGVDMLPILEASPSCEYGEDFGDSPLATDTSASKHPSWAHSSPASIQSTNKNKQSTTSNSNVISNKTSYTNNNNQHQDRNENENENGGDGSRFEDEYYSIGDQVEVESEESEDHWIPAVICKVGVKGIMYDVKYPSNNNQVEHNVGFERLRHRGSNSGSDAGSDGEGHEDADMYFDDFAPSGEIIKGGGGGGGGGGWQNESANSLSMNDALFGE
eukprot:gene8072-16565_t